MAGNERGAALILTLLVVVLLVALVLEFDRSTRIGLMAAGNFRDGVQAGFLAKAGVAVGRGLLKDDALHSSHYDGLDEAWAKPIPPLGAGEGSMTITIQDETGKLNPNHLVDGATRKKIPSKVAQMRRLLESLQLDPRLVDVMVDWLDPDDEPEPFGAEQAYYGGLEPPYRTKNGPFESLSELHLLKGVTDDVYRTLAPYLTVDTQSPGRININTADPVVLRILDLRISFDVAERIARARPFRRLDDLDRVGGMEQVARELRVIAQAYDIRSDTFSIISQGQARGTSRVVRATVVRVLLPFQPPEVRIVSLRME